MSDETSIFWFRQDLRLGDNAALTAALGSSRRVIPLYIWSPGEEGRWLPGVRSRWWLYQSLSNLSASLEAMGLRLIIRNGPAAAVLDSLVRETGASALYLNKRYEPAAAGRDLELMTGLAARGVESYPFNDTTLFDPEAVRNQAGGPFKVFTPFWRHLLSLDDPGWTIPKPRRGSGTGSWPAGLPLSRLDLLKDPARNPSGGWSPGEQGALKALKRFLSEPSSNYARDRDRPDEAGTSRLSPHLHFGEISPRRIWHEVRKTEEGSAPPGAEAFLRQLAWREFSYHLLHHFPGTAEEPWRRQYGSFPWRDDRDGFRRWSEGATGYPIVDAGMRELLETGWMHNRVRLITASFLTKHLLIHWLEGSGWFWSQLVDADLANNTMGWQWTAGCGADAAPYFRIFNPVQQGRRHDPDGGYVRRWLPELAGLPARYIHAPWTAPAAVLAESKVNLGHSYPKPMVDHAEARRRALAAYRQILSPPSSP